MDWCCSSARFERWPGLERNAYHDISKASLALLRISGTIGADHCACDPGAGSPVQIGAATNTVTAWLQLDHNPLGEKLGGRIQRVEIITDSAGEPLYYAANLEPDGFVIVSGDDLVEPIIAFGGHGRFDPASKSPLVAFLGDDLPARVTQARALRAASPTGHFLRARDKWRSLQRLYNGDTNSAPTPSSLSNVSDMRIAPFVQTMWNQGTANNGLACYNYYTPPYAAGAPSNYVCGCVATCLAQLVGYFQYPTGRIGTNSFPISINGTNTTARVRGGDGLGGPYVWTNMPPNPNNPSVAQCQTSAR